MVVCGHPTSTAGSVVLVSCGCTLLVPLSVHLPQFAPCMQLPGAVPWWVSLPGPAVALICPFWCHLFATAVTCWMRECICDPCPPPLSPCLMHLPECGSGPWYTLCGLVALLSLPSIPHPSGGWWKSWILRVYIGHTWCGLAPRATRAGGLVRWWGSGGPL